MTRTRPAAAACRPNIGRRGLRQALLASCLALLAPAVATAAAPTSAIWPDGAALAPAPDPAGTVAVALPGGILGRATTAARATPALLETVLPGPGAVGTAIPASLGAPVLSGLPWRSGASCAEADFEAWRGRRLDANVTFVAHRTWDEMYARLRGSWYRHVVRRSPQNVLSLPLMPHTHKKQHAACAAGAFDAHFRAFGALMVQGGGGGAIVRLGWEPNVGSGSHPWGVDTAADIPAYKACFRRLVGVLRSAAPGIMIEWTNAKKGKLPVSVLDAYPGDDVVDVWGVHYYDSGPQRSTQAVWDEYHRATWRGGPLGLGAWLDAARARGKMIGVPEWGVWDQGAGPTAADNPLYVENMYRFFRDNAADIAYENYYNCPARHRIHPATPYPRASARYRELWSAGQ